MVRKILRCLPKSWMPKVTAIEEAKDLNTLPLEELLGSLITHEMTIKNHEDEDENEVSELLELLENFSQENTSLKRTIKALNKENVNLKHEIECLSSSDNKTISLEKENETLKVEINALKKTFSKFSNSSEKLDNLLGLQRCVFNKAGLGYDEMNNVKHFQKYLEKKDSRKTSSSITCNYCNKNGHTTHNCYHKRNDMHKRNLLLKNKVLKLRTVWVPKEHLLLTPLDPNQLGYQSPLLKLSCFVDVTKKESLVPR
ncbi:UBN2 domain-containing protein [Cephalotus follicularis]|uniref:UBN2 domain-containing protein n=1 Tax=Cephalotus follicularis TaxID=3775 RepID=A0A1Q3CMY3_CEPFO|nr:UBN2 domain-containing protein [Cephalotus follicularis]